MKKETIWIIVGIMIFLVLIGLRTDSFPFAIAGGGAGSSISQVIGGVWTPIYCEGDYIDDNWIAFARPPVGETWLITGYTGAIYCEIITGDIYDECVNIHAIPSTDRLFIDHNYYLACPDTLSITGVRV